MWLIGFVTLNLNVIVFAEYTFEPLYGGFCFCEAVVLVFKLCVAINACQDFLWQLTS